MSTQSSPRTPRRHGGSLLESTLARRSKTDVAANGPDSAGPNPLFADESGRHALIERAAYFLAEQRGFEPGHELEDWCEAERDIDARLFRGESLLP